ncbi:MAG: phosphomevalonate kinase [Candidatus Aenigmarchaeota archaeon]|nr:phosphomevalonate kinase [Candidatus Aenigmarchaeota archaeon]
MIHYSAPGKLFVSGEWAILEMGTKGIVAAVNSRVHVFVEPLAGYNGISVTAREFKITDARAKMLNGKLVFMNADDKTKETLRLLGEAVTVAVKYAEEKGLKFVPFKITTESRETLVSVDGEHTKVGFGSSAAVVVAAIAAILDLHGHQATNEEIYKLAAIAHYTGQGKVGSGFDVAASTFGGVFVYSRFDPEWLVRELEKKRLSDVVSEQWPSFHVEKLANPSGLMLLVGWTKEPASTSTMVKRMNEFKAINKERYAGLMQAIGGIAESTVEAWKNGDKGRIIALLRENEDALRRLGDETGVPIETPDLRKLAEAANACGAAGKLSGAGGGDCGIAVCFDEATARRVREAWDAAGIRTLDVAIDGSGVKQDYSNTRK